MVRRANSAVFGGLFVFPGGVVDPVDTGALALRAVTGTSSRDGGWRAAGLRETAEEVGIYLTDRAVSLPDRPLTGADVYRWVVDQGACFDARRLRYLSTWVTPLQAPQRFDARFYLAVVGGGESLVLAPRELTESVWIRHARALQHVDSGKWKMILPTEKMLAYLRCFETSRKAWDSVDETKEVTPVLPKMVIHESGFDALLPGDPGYEEAE